MSSILVFTVHTPISDCLDFPKKVASEYHIYRYYEVTCSFSQENLFCFVLPRCFKIVSLNSNIEFTEIVQAYS